jgi:hypothetical protein
MSSNTRTTGEPIITITMDPDDTYTIQVRAAHSRYTNDQGTVGQDIDVSPTPTWMAPQELSDAIAKAVREVCDAMYYHDSGSIVDHSTCTH